MENTVTLSFFQKKTVNELRSKAEKYVFLFEFKQQAEKKDEIIKQKDDEIKKLRNEKMIKLLSRGHNNYRSPSEFSTHSNIAKHNCDLHDLCIISQEDPDNSAIPVEVWSPAIGKFKNEVNSIYESRRTGGLSLADTSETKIVRPLLRELCNRQKSENDHRKNFKNLLEVFMGHYDIRECREGHTEPDLAVFCKEGENSPDIIVKVKKAHQCASVDPLDRNYMLLPNDFWYRG